MTAKTIRDWRAALRKAESEGVLLCFSDGRMVGHHEGRQKFGPLGVLCFIVYRHRIATAKSNEGALIQGAGYLNNKGYEEVWEGYIPPPLAKTIGISLLMQERLLSAAGKHGLKGVHALLDAYESKLKEEGKHHVTRNTHDARSIRRRNAVR